jgi:DNA-binding transcriptional LysR family regulator
MDWEDLKHFLQVADAGSTLAASRRLGVSQTTAARRVAGLERAIGVRLFDRSPAGYALKQDGEALHRRARAAAAAITVFEEQAASLARTVGRVVRTPWSRHWP